MNMKKIIFAFFSLVILLISQTGQAQIVGNDTHPVKRDTVRRMPMDTIPTRYRDTVRKYNNTKMYGYRYDRRDSLRRDSLRRAQADRRRDSIQWKRRADSTAKAIEDKTAHAGASVVAAIKDRSLKNIKGPHGETVYVDKYDRHYYIDKEGKHVYMKRQKSK